MRIHIEGTSQMVEVNGVPARVWEGTTDSGQRVFCCVTRIATPESEDQSKFQAELREQKPPSNAAREVFPLRMII